ncbi:MAG: hypothetical protein AB7P02_23630 [Alphaproteobacteria bacterium]
MLPPAMAQLLASLDAIPEPVRNPVQRRLARELAMVSEALGRAPPLPGIDLRLEPWGTGGAGRCFVCGR